MGRHTRNSLLDIEVTQMLPLRSRVQVSPKLAEDAGAIDGMAEAQKSIKSMPGLILIGIFVQMILTSLLLTTVTWHRSAVRL